MPGGAGTTRRTAPGTHYGFIQLESFAMQAGFNPAEAKIAAAISLSESSGDPTAVNPRSGATGLWQLMPSNIARFHVTNPKDPAENARGAYAVYKAQGWHAWTTYGGPVYQKNMTDINNSKSLGEQIPIISAPMNALDAFGGLVAKLTSGGFWTRVGIGALGFFVIVVALLIVLGKHVESGQIPIPPVV